MFIHSENVIVLLIGIVDTPLKIFIPLLSIGLFLKLATPYCFMFWSIIPVLTPLLLFKDPS